VKSIVLEYLQGAVDFYEEIAKKKVSIEKTIARPCVCGRLSGIQNIGVRKTFET
jgi:hypothetical protein